MIDWCYVLWVVERAMASPFALFTQGFSFLNVLSLLAFFTTVGLFFCGIPICRQIWKRRDTKEISGAPFLMGIVGGCCWLTYGYLKKDWTVIVVTGTQVILYTSYTTFYWFMTKQKLGITLKVLAVAATCASLFSAVYFFGQSVFHPLGIVCMTLNTADFAAPLMGIKVVIRRRATSTLPLPLCIANFLVSSEWFLYGLLVKDFYLITPNGIGSVLAFLQLLLFVFLPRKPGQRAPLLRLFDTCLRKNTDDDSDPATPETDAEDRQIVRKQRWSQRMIANVSGELESVGSKVGIYDQFGYSGKLNAVEDETASEKSADMPMESVAASQVRAAEKAASAVANQLRPHTKLQRCASSPHLSD